MKIFHLILFILVITTLVEYFVFKDMLAVAVGIICFWTGFLEYVKTEELWDW